MIRVSSGVAASRVLKLKDAMIRSELARKARDQKLVLMIDVSSDGKPTCVAMMRSGLMFSDDEIQEFIQAVFKAAQDWHFAPYILNGEPVTFKTLAGLKVKVEKGDKPSTVAAKFGAMQ
jgi:hypothetical protein